MNYAEYLASLFGLCRSGIDPHGAVYRFFQARQMTELRDGKAWGNARAQGELTRRIKEAAGSLSAQMLLVGGMIESLEDKARMVDPATLDDNAPRRLFQELADLAGAKWQVMHRCPGGGSSDPIERAIYLPAPGDASAVMSRLLTQTDPWIIGLHELGHLHTASPTENHKLAIYNMMRTMGHPVSADMRDWIVAHEIAAWQWADQYRGQLPESLQTDYDELRENGINSYRKAPVSTHD